MATCCSVDNCFNKLSEGLSFFRCPKHPTSWTQPMVFRYSYLLPPALGILTAITVTITYVWSISNKHVKRIFPYISDTGTWPPESCIFSLLLYVISVLMAFINYIRFRQVRHTYDSLSPKKRRGVQKLNFFGHCCGYIACFGLVIVASFQETNAFWPHVVGATCAFGIGCFYQLLQTIISWRIYPTIGLRYVNIIRIVLTAISTISYWLFQIFGYFAMINFKGESITLWNKNDGGYNYHLISTVTEWILTVSTMTYFVLYTEEFKGINFSEPEFIVQT